MHVYHYFTYEETEALRHQGSNLLEVTQSVGDLGSERESMLLTPMLQSSAVQ